MSAREFKPGDVAMVTWSSYDGREGGRSHAWLDATECWNFAGRSSIHASRADLIDDARPLVVIDPEDREQVERLLAAYHGWKWEGIDAKGACITDMQGALREFADPKPRIEEPTGLGAVVEAAHEEKWLRFESCNGSWWRNRDGENKRWADLDVVRVLSEGVTS